MDNDYVKIEVELIIVDNEVDFRDPLDNASEYPDLEGDDTITTKLQLHDDASDDSEFRIEPKSTRSRAETDNLSNHPDDVGCSSDGSDIAARAAFAALEGHDGRGAVEAKQSRIQSGRRSPVRTSTNRLSHLSKVDKPDQTSAIEESAMEPGRKSSKRTQITGTDRTIETDSYTIEKKALPKRKVKNKGPEVYRCRVCDGKWNKSSSYTEHMRKEHSIEKPFDCSICEKSYRIHSLLLEHMKSHTGEKPYKCDICEKSFAQIGPFNVHKRKHTGDRPYKCNICVRAFIDTKSFNAHMRVHAGNEPFQCTLCPRKFVHKGTFTAHLRTHTGERPYQCTICGKNFGQSASYQKHMRTHTGDMPYACDQCDKRFNQSVNLKTHMRVHTGDQPYKCDTCGRTFSHSKSYQIHLRLHTGEKPYDCPACGKAFRHANSQKRHILMHTGEKKHVCNVCGKRYSQSSSLATHMLKHGNGDKLKDDALKV